MTSKGLLYSRGATMQQLMYEQCVCVCVCVCVCAYTHKKNVGYSYKESQIHLAHNLTDKVEKFFSVLFF